MRHSLQFCADMKAIAVWTCYAMCAICPILAIGSILWLTIDSDARWPARVIPPTVCLWALGYARMFAGGTATQFERPRPRPLDRYDRAPMTPENRGTRLRLIAKAGRTLVKIGLTVVLWFVASFLVSAAIEIMLRLSPGDPVLSGVVPLARMVVLPLVTAPVLFLIWQRHDISQPAQMTPWKRGMCLISKIGLTVVSWLALSLIAAIAIAVTLGRPESVAVTALPLLAPVLFLIWGDQAVTDLPRVETYAQEDLAA